MRQPVLRVERVSKGYAGTPALDQVTLELHRGEVAGLVGANGAGKSTLLKLVAGLCQPDSGRILLHGQDDLLKDRRTAMRAGIGMVFQEQSLLPTLSVAENIMLGHEDAALRLGLVYNWRALNALAAAQLAKLGSSIAPETPTASLSFGERQVVELAKVLTLAEHAHRTPVILLDEPTSMLEAAQRDTVLAHIRRLRQAAAVLFVSHRLDEVLQVCDRIHVLRAGRCVAECRPSGCSAELLKRLMLEPALAGSPPPALPASARKPRAASAQPGQRPPRLQVLGLNLRLRYQEVSFDLRAGEVLGIAGTEGSGREALCRTLFGAQAPDGGRIRGRILLDGLPIRLDSPADAVRHGIAYVPAERLAEGIVAALSVRDNMILAQLDQLRRGPLLDGRRARALVRQWMAYLNIEPRNPAAKAQHLSGGNQQKLALAKWLLVHPPKVLILDHPTRGLDVGARADVHRLIGALAAGGVSVVLLADTLEESMALCDSLLVMRGGAVTGRFAVADGSACARQVQECMS